MIGGKNWAELEISAIASNQNSFKKFILLQAFFQAR